MVFLSQRVCIFLRLFISLVRVLSRKATPNLCAASSRWHSLVPPTRSRSGLSSENPRHHLISSHCFTLNLFSCLLKCIFLSYAFSHFIFFSLTTRSCPLPIFLLDLEWASNRECIHLFKSHI